MTFSKQWIWAYLVIISFVTLTVESSVPDLANAEDGQAESQLDQAVFHDNPLAIVPVKQENHKPVVPVRKVAKIVDSDLEATLTLAELQEILIKIDQDLNERIHELDYADKQEIIKILKMKKEYIIAYLKELQGFDEETVALYLLLAQRKPTNTFFWRTVGVCSLIVAVSTLMAASYDPVTGMNRPTLDQLKSNTDGVVQWTQDWAKKAWSKFGSFVN